jgi:hypothetical protein
LGGICRPGGWLGGAGELLLKLREDGEKSRERAHEEVEAEDLLEPRVLLAHLADGSVKVWHGLQRALSQLVSEVVAHAQQLHHVQAALQRRHLAQGLAQIAQQQAAAHLGAAAVEQAEEGAAGVGGGGGAGREREQVHGEGIRGKEGDGLHGRAVQAHELVHAAQLYFVLALRVVAQAEQLQHALHRIVAGGQLGVHLVHDGLGAGLHTQDLFKVP